MAFDAASAFTMFMPKLASVPQSAANRPGLIRGQHSQPYAPGSRWISSANTVAPSQLLQPEMLLDLRLRVDAPVACRKAFQETRQFRRA